MEIALPLLGGVGLFLLGMSLMTDGLKLIGGEALRSILANWTKTPLRGLGAGALITGIVQSSSAVKGLLILGQAIRDFIERLSRRPLPEEVVQALPDIIRAVQHLEEIGAISAELARDPPPPSIVLAGPHWRRFDTVVAAALTDGRALDFQRQSDEVEGDYQHIKQILLTATAGGQLSVYDMEPALLRARRLRRICEAALKARRRLATWTALAGEVVGSQSAS